MFRKLIGACVGLAMMGMAGTANAIVMIDFEGTGLSEGDLITTGTFGLTIGGGELVTEGSPRFGFISQFGDDTVDDGAPFDDDFLAPISSSVGHIISIDFHGLVTNLVFTLGDIDPAPVSEIVEITAYDSSNFLLETITIESDDPNTDDGFGTLVDFGTLSIASIEIKNLTAAAYGVDNIMYISEPSTLALFATGLVLLAFLGWRRRRPVQLKAA
jgi:hypothetical protein